jgi:glutathione S-transferase
MTGAPEFERALRVQGNTVEQVIIFLPLLWVAALYFQGWWAPACGLVWCLGRTIYAFGYMKAPASRSAGFIIAFAATFALAILAIIGVVQAWMASA